MSGITRVSFECAKCGMHHRIRITVEDPNLMGDTAEEQTRYGYQDFECPCGNKIEFDISNDVDSVIVDAPFGGAKNIRTERPVYECFCDEAEYLEYCKALYDNEKINTFMSSFLNLVKADFQKNVLQLKSQKRKLCEIDLDYRQIQNAQQYYAMPEYQQYYLLRYFYAYFLEYHFLYKKIQLEDYKIFSVGCGPYLDLIALFYVLWEKKEKISYMGIDPIYWLYKKHFAKAKTISFQNLSLKDFLNNGENIDNFNVILFPKSIEHLNDDIPILLDKIKATAFKEEKLYLILNGMNSRFSDDEILLDSICDALCDKGYKIKDVFVKRDPDVLEKRFEDLPESIRYPIDKAFFSNLPKDCYNFTVCNIPLCKMNKGPMTNTTSFNFKIIKLELL